LLRELQESALAGLGGDLGAHNAQLLLGEGGFLLNLLEKLRKENKSRKMSVCLFVCFFF
jgi:hypothetical protein